MLLDVGGSTPGHSVPAGRARLASEARREVWRVPPGMKSCGRMPAARSAPTAATAPVPSERSISILLFPKSPRVAVFGSLQAFQGMKGAGTVSPRPLYDALFLIAKLGDRLIAIIHSPSRTR
jgi:hypothetical protein